MSTSHSQFDSISTSESMSGTDSTSLSTSLSHSASTSNSTSMTTSESQSNNDSQMHSNSLHHDAKDELPDTGDSDSNSTGLVSAVAAMLAGLGLFGKSRKIKR